MIHADADPACVVGQVINAVGIGATQFRDEVMHSHLLRISLRTHFPPAILEVAHQLLLLRVDRNHRLLISEATLDLPIDVLKLSVAVRVTVAFLGLLICLQAVAQFVQQFRHHRITD